MRRLHVSRSAFIAWLAMVLLACVVPPSIAQESREWTVMVYMNGKNNLEPFALANFHSMAAVGSTNEVAVVAQLGRPESTRYSNEDGGWGGVYRFHITKGMRPIPSRAAVDVKQVAESTDMGQPAALEQFIEWSKKSYPAKRYMLVIWNHGQGWRLQLAAKRETRQLAASGRLSLEQVKTEVPTNLPVVGGYRAVSSDDDTGSILYNREVQDVLGRQFASRKLDLLGYDACLMAMLETAYGLTGSTEVMVASEELEPGTGWNYALWLRKLVADPNMGPERLGSELVEAYQQEYEEKGYLTTLSAIRLSGIRQASSLLSSFSTAVLGNQTELSAMRRARQELESYGASAQPPLRTYIDMTALLKKYEAKSSNGQLRARSAQVRAAVQAVVVKNYASERSRYPDGGPHYGSEGLAIYYPDSAEAFLRDPFHTGYLKSNTDRPVDFVLQEKWADLLYKLLDVSVK